MSQREHTAKMTRDMESFSERDEHVVFVPSEHDGDLWEEFVMDWDVWCRMGKPNEIQVSVTIPAGIGDYAPSGEEVRLPGL